MSENNDVGCIPTMDGGGGESGAALGEVKTETRSKTNIQAFFKVGIVIGLIVFLAACLIIYQKLKPKNVTSVSVEKKIEMPIFAQKNSAVKSDDIDTKKAEIVKSEAQNSERMAAIGVAGQGGHNDVAQVACVGDKCPPPPEQRKLQGDVLVAFQPAATSTNASDSNKTGGNGLPAGCFNPRPP